MRIFLGLLLFFYLCYTPLYAQQKKEVQYIRQIYKDISEKIENCLTNKETCDLYCNRWTVNVCNRGNWSIDGQHEEKWNFWYDTTPDSWEKNIPEENHLQKIIIDTKATATTHEEYVFSEGDLIFYFYAINEDSLSGAYRFYFKKNRLIEFSSEHGDDNMEEPYKTKSDTQLILENAKKFQKHFVQMAKL